MMTLAYFDLDNYSTTLYTQVRMQVGSLKEYEARQGMIKSFSRIYHTEGLKGLYRVSTIEYHLDAM